MTLYITALTMKTMNFKFSYTIHPGMLVFRKEIKIFIAKCRKTCKWI